MTNAAARQSYLPIIMQNKIFFSFLNYTLYTRDRNLGDKKKKGKRKNKKNLI